MSSEPRHSQPKFYGITKRAVATARRALGYERLLITQHSQRVSLSAVIDFIGRSGAKAIARSCDGDQVHHKWRALAMTGCQFARFLSVFLSVYLAGGCGWLRGRENTPDPVRGAEDLRMLVERSSTEPAEISRSLELQPQKDYLDFIDLGTAYIWQGEFTKAAEAYEYAGRAASTVPELAGALHNKALALAYAGMMPEAIRTADIVVQIAPSNVEAAWLRYSLHLRSSDKLGLAAAADHVARLDPSTSGQEVLTGIDALVIVAAMAIVVPAVFDVAMLALVPPEDRGEVVVPMMNGYHRTVGVVAQAAMGALAPGIAQTETLARNLAKRSK